VSDDARSRRAASTAARVLRSWRSRAWLSVAGVHGPMEMSGAASPRQALTALHDYLASHLEATLLPCTLETIDRLVGDDERWTNPAAAMDPSQSIGASPEANELRLVTDDLVAALASQSPRLIAATSRTDWRRACLYGRTAAGLLRYQAKMADTSDSRVARLSRLLGQRDAMMAANLQAVVAHEAQRGPTLVFAHDRHLQKDLSTWQLPAGWDALQGMTLSWWAQDQQTVTNIVAGYI
jgi:erythromycin esterase-like protein